MVRLFEALLGCSEGGIRAVSLRRQFPCTDASCTRAQELQACKASLPHAAPNRDFACCKDTQLQQPASGRGSDSGPQSPEAAAAAVAPSDAAATAAAGLTVAPTPAATRDQHDRSATIRSYACYPDGSSSSSSSNNGNSGNQQMLLLSPQPEAASHLRDDLLNNSYVAEEYMG